MDLATPPPQDREHSPNLRETRIRSCEVRGRWFRTYSSHSPQPPSTFLRAFRFFSTQTPFWHQAPSAHGVPSPQGMCRVWQLSESNLLHQRALHTGCNNAISEFLQSSFRVAVTPWDQWGGTGNNRQYPRRNHAGTHHERTDTRAVAVQKLALPVADDRLTGKHILRNLLDDVIHRRVSQTEAVPRPERGAPHEICMTSGKARCNGKSDSLQEFGDEVPAAFGPGPRIGSLLQRGRHHVADRVPRRMISALDFGVVMGHVEAMKINISVIGADFNDGLDCRYAILHVAEFVSDGEGSAETVVLYQRATAFIAHRSQFGQSQSLAFFRGGVSADIFPENRADGVTWAFQTIVGLAF